MKRLTLFSLFLCSLPLCIGLLCGWQFRFRNLHQFPHQRICGFDPLVLGHDHILMVKQNMFRVCIADSALYDRWRQCPLFVKALGKRVDTCHFDRHQHELPHPTGTRVQTLQANYHAALAILHLADLGTSSSEICRRAEVLLSKLSQGSLLSRCDFPPAETLSATDLPPFLPLSIAFFHHMRSQSRTLLTQLQWLADVCGLLHVSTRQNTN